jgi:hypothetical protein
MGISLRFLYRKTNNDKEYQFNSPELNNINSTCMTPYILQTNKFCDHILDKIIHHFSHTNSAIYCNVIFL